ncbi:protein kinase [Candidatus Woesearchaeota archaeon]|nr:protein kinase [Candidatus Woesearchaeota archaeon]
MTKANNIRSYSLEDIIIGHTIDHVFEGIRKRGEGGKKYIFEVRDTVLDRLVSMKVPNEKTMLEEWRVRQILEEGKKHAKLSKHPNIEKIYTVGTIAVETQASLKEIPYLITELIDGENLKQIIDKETPQKKDIWDIITSMSSALEFAHSHNVAHRDVKLKNIMREKGPERTTYLYNLVDFGRKSYERDSEGQEIPLKDAFKEDIQGLGTVIEQLYETGKHSIDSNLEAIIAKAKSEGPDGYERIDELAQALKQYWRQRMTRRTFLKTAPLFALGIVTSTYFIIKDDERGMRRLQAAIAETDAQDKEALQPLYQELLHELYSKKMRYWLEQGLLPEGHFLWLAKDDWYHLSDQNPPHSIDGKTIQLLERGYHITDNGFFHDAAVQKLQEMTWPLTDRIRQNEEDKSDLVRFYDAHAWMYDLYQEEAWKEIALKAAEELQRERYNEKGFYQFDGILIDGKSVDLKKDRIYTESVDTIIPYLWWANKYIGKYEERITRHLNHVLQHSIRADGTVKEVVRYDQKAETYNKSAFFYAYNDRSTLARLLGRTALGLLKSQPFVDEATAARIEHTVKQQVEYFLAHNPADGIPYYDYIFSDEELRVEKDPPKDASAAVYEAQVLQLFSRQDQNPRYEAAILKKAHSMVTQHLITDKNVLGLFSGATPDKKYYRNASWINSDLGMIQVLQEIIKK